MITIDLKDKVALITGASGGIGSATVQAFTNAGATVIAVDRRPPTHGKFNGRYLEADVKHFKSVEECVMNILSNEGRVDCLINNAGISIDAPVWKMTEEMWDEVLDVNLKSAFNFIHHLAPHFRERQSGKIVNVASINGMRGKFGLANYAASKAGLIGLTKTISKELARYHINVNAVAPGLISTPLVSQMDPDALNQAKSEILLGELGQPEDIANSIVFLCSDLAKHITGEVLKIDGGQYI